MAARDIVVRIRANTTGLVTGIKTAQANVASFSREIEKSGAKRAAIRDLGTEFGKMGLVAAAGVGLAVRAFANFDQAMSNIKSLGSDARQNIDALTQAAIKWGQRTQFSATEAAGGIEELMKAGVSAKDVLGGGLQGALNLAAAGQISVAEAAQTAATAMVQFNLKGRDVPHIADLLAAAANKAQGGVSDMGQALKFVGPIAAQMGVSIEETTGTIAELAQSGILADQAGTGLRGMLLSLTSPSKIARDTMDGLGISVYDAQGKFVGFGGVAGQLHDKMKDLTAAERDQAFGRLFGNAQITAARILYKGGADDVAKWTKAVNDQGYAADTARTKMDNLKGDLEQLKGALETALIKTGGNANGPLRVATEDITKLVNAYSALPSAAQGAALGFAGLVAVAGGGVFVYSRVVGTFADINKALDQISQSSPRAASGMAKIGKAAVAITAAIVAYEGLKAVSKLGESDGAGTSKMTAALVALSKGSKGARVELDKLATIKVSKWNLLNGGEPGIKGIADAFKSLDGGLKVIDKLSPYNTKSERASKVIDQLDTSLAGLVSGGHSKVAADDIAYFAKVSGESVDKIKSKLPQYSAALRDLDTATKLATTGGKGKVKPPTLNEMFGITDKDQAKLEKAASKTAGQFVNISSAVDKAKGSVREFEKTLLDQAKALTNFGSNATKALAKGLDSGLVSQLEQMGPAGAKIMQELANSSQAEIGRVNAAFDKGSRAIDNFVRLTGTIPAELETQFKPAGASGAVAQAVKVANAYHLSPDVVTTILEALDYSSADIKAVLALLNKADGKTAVTKITTVDKATGVIKTVITALNKANGKVAVTTIRTNRVTHVSTIYTSGGKHGSNQADGSVMDFYANGGMAENHVAQIAPAGAWRTWAEPETGGESYIPLAPSKRQRSLEIWAQTGNRLGVQGFADGGFSQSSTSEAGGSPMDERSLSRAFAKALDGMQFDLSQDNRYLKTKVRRG